MYIPINPNKSKDITNKLKISLTKNKYSYLIENKKQNILTDAVKINEYQANQIIDRFIKANFAKIGANKMLPIPPHFAIDYTNNLNKGVVTELITLDNQKNTINNALELLIQFTFFELKDLAELTIPYSIDLTCDSSFSTSALADGTILVTRN